MKILFVDDSKAVHGYLKNCFQKTDCELVHAMDGGEALEKLAQDSGIELIFLDWEMPGMTGPEVLGQIKEKQVQAPVIMLTSRNSVEDITEVLKKGAAEYVMKPFTDEILFEKIESVTGVKVS